MTLTLYWAGPLFTQAERVWNRRCTATLRDKGYDVILPQDEADAFITDGVVDMEGIAEQCYRQVVASDVVVAVLDGADSDSGTSVEVGIKIGHRRATSDASTIIGVRTDFRTSEDGQLNGMFRLVDAVVAVPSFDEDPAALCEQIHETIQRLRP
jgi:nucleoside 2-deoxyribosyltransferase